MTAVGPLKSEPLWKWIEKDFYLDVICNLNTSRNEVQIKDILLTYITTWEIFTSNYALPSVILVPSNTSEKVLIGQFISMAQFTCLLE